MTWSRKIEFFAMCLNISRLNAQIFVDLLQKIVHKKRPLSAQTFSFCWAYFIFMDKTILNFDQNILYRKNGAYLQHSQPFGFPVS